MLLLVSCDQSHVQQAQTTIKAAESELDKEIRQVMEKGINLEERKRQVPVIAEVFARRTEPKRARWLAALCYFKTLGTSLMPIDLAEIALAETGAYGLSGIVRIRVRGIGCLAVDAAPGQEPWLLSGRYGE